MPVWSSLSTAKDSPSSFPSSCSQSLSLSQLHLRHQAAQVGQNQPGFAASAAYRAAADSTMTRYSNVSRTARGSRAAA